MKPWTKWSIEERRNMALFISLTMRDEMAAGRMDFRRILELNELVIFALGKPAELLNANISKFHDWIAERDRA
jgi:hypothetical protein